MSAGQGSGGKWYDEKRCFQNQLAERGVFLVVKFSLAERYVKSKSFV